MSLRRIAVLVGVSTAALVAQGAGAAGPLHVSAPVAVTGRSPFPLSCTPEWAHGYHHAESEVSLAVDPTNGNHLLATYHQDGNVAHPVSRSLDGGATWQQIVVPGLTPCTVPPGSDAPTWAVFDPWVSYGADGRAYLLSTSGADTDSPARPAADAAAMQDSFARHVFIQVSSDDGATWSEPYVAGGDVDNGFIIDKPTVTADPYRPGHAYATWTRVSLTGAGLLGFASTADGGRTWTEQLLPLTTTDTRGVVFGSQVVVLRDGTLVLTFGAGVAQTLAVAGLATSIAGVQGLPRFVGGTDFYSIRSTDGGATWPTQGSPIGSSQTFPSLVTTATDGTNVYATYDDTASDDTSSVMFSRSSDGGTTWSAPTRLAGPHASTKVPAVAVDGTGAVAVSWYDAGSSAAERRGRVAVSRDGGRSWSRAALTPSFSISAAPGTNAAGGLPLGDYEGLVGLPNGGFVSAMTVAGASSVGGPTDVVSSRIHLDRRR
jgi:hypothetical protein